MVLNMTRVTKLHTVPHCGKMFYNSVRRFCYVCVLLIILLQFKNAQYWMQTSHARLPLQQVARKAKSVDSKPKEPMKEDLNKMIHNIIRKKAGLPGNYASLNNTSLLEQAHDRHNRDDDVNVLNDKNGSKPNLESSLMKAESMKWGSSPLLVLFTSWEYAKEKASVHQKVLRLWASWNKYTVRPVVYSSVTKVRNMAEASGWHVRPISKANINPECQGPPVLRALFTDAFENFRSFLYGYSNSDIVFGDGLEKTLKFIQKNYLWHSRPLLIIGRRYNFDYVQNKVQLNSPNDVKQLTKQGTLVARSTDYFFTNILFPWYQLVPVSIGRPFVVRAVIGYAIMKHIDIIDATKTIEAVHLTTADGAHASFNVQKGVDCNRHLLNNDSSQLPVRLGHCECVGLETDSDADGDIYIRSRDPDSNICKRW